ncbi:hypothetical protein GEMRC1_010264 [Eukaryota sp. GEM-RC1]
MRLITLLFLILTIVWAGCRCPRGCSFPYRGSHANCFCFCQRTAKSLDVSPGARCTFVNHFSRGSCSLCDIYISSSSDDSSSVTEVFERSLSDAILPIVDSNADFIFPITRCKCPSGCDWPYRGSHSQCANWAREQAHLFVNEQFTIKYYPSGQFSRGGCSVCGKTDPCKEFR